MNQDAHVLIKPFPHWSHFDAFCGDKLTFSFKQTLSLSFPLHFSASFSELLILVVAIGGAITAVVLILVAIASYRKYKRRQRQLEDNEEAPRKERKDPTVW